MENKIKWEEHYDDLLFDFIQFRSEHPNGNLSDSVKDYKTYMTKEPEWEIFESYNGKIFSVKRKSDQQVFSIGDEIGWGEVGNYKTKIEDFQIKNGRLKIGYNSSPKNKDYVDFLTAIRLHHKIKEEQPFKWSDELVKEYGEWYKITQGNLNTYSDLWGKDLFKFFKDMHLIKQQTNTIPSGEPKPMNDFMEETKITVPSQPKTERIEVRTDDGNVVYTKEQLREAERRAFNAARGINLEKAYHRQYATFEDYKKLNP